MAAITSAVIAGGTALYSANKQKDAARDASRAQAGAAQDSNKLLWDMYQQTRADNDPFRQNALTAQQEYMTLLGLASPQAAAQPTPSTPPNAGTSPGGGFLTQLQGGGLPGWRGGAGIGSLMEPGQVRSIGGAASNPGGTSPTPQIGGQIGTGGQTPPAQLDPAAAQQSAFDRFRNTPGYQSGLDEGRGQLESSAAARGGLYSGATLKALQRYGNDYADQQGFSPYMNRLASLAGMGQTVNQQNAQMGWNTASGMGQNLMAAGNARASGLYAQGQASAGLAQNVTGIAGMLGGYYSNRGYGGGGGG